MRSAWQSGVTPPPASVAAARSNEPDTTWHCHVCVSVCVCLCVPLAARPTLLAFDSRILTTSNEGLHHRCIFYPCRPRPWQPGTEKACGTRSPRSESSSLRPCPPHGLIARSPSPYTVRFITPETTPALGLATARPSWRWQRRAGKWPWLSGLTVGTQRPSAAAGGDTRKDSQHRGNAAKGREGTAPAPCGSAAKGRERRAS